MHTPQSRRYLLTGCSPSSGVGSSNDSSPHSGERTGKEILFYLSAGHDFAPYKRVISKFEQDHKVKVTIQTFQWPDLQQKLTADFLSGTTPDITEEPGGFWATQFGNDGNIMALDDYIKKDKGFLDDFVPAGLDAPDHGRARLRQHGNASQGQSSHAYYLGRIPRGHQAHPSIWC